MSEKEQKQQRAGQKIFFGSISPFFLSSSSSSVRDSYTL